MITDGVISLPDATVFDSLLVQLRNQTIACSFLQLGSVYHPQASLGYVPFSDLMNFLATATCGAYLATLPQIVSFLMNFFSFEIMHDVFYFLGR